MKRSLLLLALLSTTATAACSSSDSSSGPGTGPVPSALSSYCTGTLKVATQYMTAVGPGAYSGHGDTLPAGTKILLSWSFDRWAGFAFQTDGTVLKLEADFSKGLVLGTDFDSTCTADQAKDSKKQHTVILQRSTVYPEKGLTGTACTLEVGTVMTNYSFSGDGTSSTVSSAEIKSTCGLTTGYSKDIQYATLVSL